MKGLTNHHKVIDSLISPAIAALVLGAVATQTEAQIYTLSDNNSSAMVDVGSSAGMFQWQVQGANQLAQQWFWYRVGNNANAPINAISSATASTFSGSRGLTTTYGNSQFSVRIDYLLSGGSSVGAGQYAVSDIGEIITINNLSSAPLDFHFFQYSDFDLGGAGNDTVQLGRNLRGLWNEAVQTDPTAGLTETVTTPGANHGEVAYFNSTLQHLNGGTAYNLSDAAGPVGPGDVTWALQWDFSIAAGSSAQIAKDKYLSVLVVPEPSAVALIAIGLIACAARSRRFSV